MGVRRGGRMLMIEELDQGVLTRERGSEEGMDGLGLLGCDDEGGWFLVDW